MEAIGYLFEENVTVCQNEASTWHGKALNTTQAGTFTLSDAHKSVYGKDSIYQLTLTVLPVYAFPTEATMKMNESYIWRGQTFQNLTPGVYNYADSLKTIFGLLARREPCRLPKRREHMAWKDLADCASRYLHGL